MIEKLTKKEQECTSPKYFLIQLGHFGWDGSLMAITNTAHRNQQTRVCKIKGIMQKYAKKENATINQF